MADYTKSQLKTLKAANATFLALKAANPNLYYYSDGTHLLNLNYPDGSTVKNIRPDCSGLMQAIINYMGYDMVGSTTYDWYGHSSNDIIKNKSGGYSTDWLVKTWASSDTLQPGDILVTYGHTDMYVFTDSASWRRGFNAGGGNSGQVINQYAMQYSVNLANYYAATGSWTGGSSVDGGYTITPSDVASNPKTTLIRYVGSGDSPASTGGTYTNPDNKNIYDVSGFQNDILDQFTPSDCNGLIIQVGRIRSYGFSTTGVDAIHAETFKRFVNRYKDSIPLGFYIYSYVSYTTGEATTKDILREAFQFMADNGVTPDLAKLGVWLDLESDGPIPQDKDTNFKQIKWFREIATEYEYPTAGVYSNASYLETNFNNADLTDFPIWVAAWTTASSWIDNWISQTGFTKVYLWQDGAETGNVHYVGGEVVDHDVLVQPIPYGSNDYTSDDPGNSSTGTGTYAIVPAKKIIFNPPPTKINPNTIISVDTDVADARVFVTMDNTEPNFKNKNQDWTGRRFIFNSNAHLRAYAFDSQGTVLAKGAATYTIRWARPSNENIDDLITAFHEHREPKLQPYLQYHPEDVTAAIEDYTEIPLEDDESTLAPDSSDTSPVIPE